MHLNLGDTSHQESNAPFQMYSPSFDSVVDDIMTCNFCLARENSSMFSYSP
jgi:hypothetical protein